MNILDDVLMEEIRKKDIDLQIKKKQIANLPRGSLFLNRVGKSVFAYRKWRDGNKIYSEYLGKVGKRETTKKIDELNKAREQIEIYKQEKRKLEELKKAYRILLLKTKLI